MDDDDDYRQTQREHRRAVIVGIVGTLAVVAFLVIRFGLRRERDDSYPTPVYTPPPVIANDLVAAREPIEFELAVGDATHDIIPGKPLALGTTQVELEQNPTWLTAGDGYHFKHRSSVSVSPTPEMVIASIDGVVLKLQTMDAKASDKDNQATLSRSITGTGQTVGKPEPVTRTIAGKPRNGLRHDTTTTMQVEVYLVPVGTQKLGVLLYRQDPTAATDKIDALLESIAEGAGEPLPQFTATVGTTKTDVFLDKPAALAPSLTATVRRRPTVLRTMVGNGGSLTFEHPRGMTVSRMPNDQMLAVTLQTDRASIQLFDLQMRFTVDELKNALLGQMAASDLGEVTHAHAGQSVRGRRLRLAQLPVEHELYVFERGGKTIGASIQYVAADEKLAIEAAMPVLLSVK